MLVRALALAGCAAASDDGSADSAPAASATAASYSEADVMFGEGMVPHHEQAVEMADIVLEKDGSEPRVIALAEQIKAAQQPEQLASGENPDALQMAQDIVDAQRAEVESMREVLASL